jgi:hypothetical protein
MTGIVAVEVQMIVSIRLALSDGWVRLSSEALKPFALAQEMAPF